MKLYYKFAFYFFSMITINSILAMEMMNPTNESEESEPTSVFSFDNFCTKSLECIKKGAYAAPDLIGFGLGLGGTFYSIEEALNEDSDDPYIKFNIFAYIGLTGVSLMALYKTSRLIKAENKLKEIGLS